jgi:hypothetical protein
VASSSGTSSRNTTYSTSNEVGYLLSIQVSVASQQAVLFSAGIHTCSHLFLMGVPLSYFSS